MRKIIKNWEEVFEQHQKSGKSIQEFCKEIEIHPNTFYKHRKRFIGDTNASVVEIKPTAISPSAPIVLKIKEYIISISTGFDENQLKSVLKVIGELE